MKIHEEARLVANRVAYPVRRIWFDTFDSSGSIVVTNCGKLGDFIAALPVASWLYKTRRRKIHFILARSFEPFTKIESLLMLQEMTERVTLVDFPVRDWECGGTPYRFDPRKHGVRCGEYYNLGLRRHPKRWVPEYIAEEWGLGYDPHFRMTLGDFARTDQTLCTDAFMLPEVPSATPIDYRDSILDNARRLAGARESHVSQSGPFHVLDYAGVRPTRVYVYPHQVNIHLFSRNVDQLDVVQVDRKVK